MGGRVKKGRFLRKYIGLISIAFILALSAVGIGYGAWNDGLQTEVTVKTGTFDPEVEITKVECYRGGNWEIKDSDNWYVTSSEDNINFKAKWAKSSKPYKIYFKVKNAGKIPIKYKVDEVGYCERIDVSLTESKPHNEWKALNQGESESDNYIRVDTDGVFWGRGTFNVQLKIKQWNL